MPTVMLEVPDSATVGEVRRIPMSRAQVVLTERAAAELERLSSGVRGQGLARELRALAEQWRGMALAAGGSPVDLDVELTTPPPEAVVP